MIKLQYNSNIMTELLYFGNHLKFFFLYKSSHLVEFVLN